MKAKTWLLSMSAMAVLFLTVSMSAWAQAAEPTEPAPPPPPHHGGAMFERMGPGFDGMGFVGFEEGLSGKTVTGAPFTASFSTQETQTLTDGNKIERTTTGTMARDTAGRTRRDMTLPAIGPWAASGKTPPQVSFINDPVAGTHYVLEANTKTARQMSARNHGPDGARAAGMAARVQKNTTTESLGTQTINGVSAQGTRTTRTIPAGEMGNEKPIVIVKETWYSPELQITVMTKRTDPRMGETISQVTNIQKQEPAATLFQVPSDYTVKQGRGGRSNAAPPVPPAEE
ncbi:MAG: hypothetical protein ABSB66_05300 [Candidatus Acidiferrales bacterium]|jgi:hypothetical protein